MILSRNRWVITELSFQSSSVTTGHITRDRQPVIVEREVPRSVLQCRTGLFNISLDIGNRLLNDIKRRVCLSDRYFSVLQCRSIVQLSHLLGRHHHEAGGLCRRINRDVRVSRNVDGCIGVQGFGDVRADKHVCPSHCGHTDARVVHRVHHSPPSTLIQQPQSFRRSTVAQISFGAYICKLNGRSEINQGNMSLSIQRNTLVL